MAPGPPAAAGDRDPGLQPERTRLAWRRTTLSCAAATVLAARQVLRSGPATVSLAAIGLSCLAWLAFLWLAQRRIHGLNTYRPGPLSPHTALGVAACTVALALFGVTILA